MVSLEDAQQPEEYDDENNGQNRAGDAVGAVHASSSLALRRVGQRQSGLDRGAASHQVDDQHHDCHHQQRVNQGATNMDLQQHQQTPERGGQYG